MKLVHTSDLHIGKKLGGISLLEDQRFILSRLYDIIISEQPDALLISGDVFDYGVPPAEAVPVLDEFLTRLSRVTLDNGKKLQTFMIYGNHDSPERVSYAGYFLAQHGVHVSPVYNGSVEPFVMHDEFGEILIYMLPFIRPAHVYNAAIFRGEENLDQISSYTEAVKRAVTMMDIDPNKRSVLLSHQFVTGASQCESETQNIGGLENVDADAYKDFNYVALGHLHTPQNVKTNSSKNVIYYSGSPLKYSFSEEQNKSAAVVTIGADGTVTLETRPLVGMRDVRTVKGTLEEIKRLREKEDDSSRNDLVRIILTGDNIPTHDYSEAVSLYSNFVTFGEIRSRSAEEEKRIRVDLGAEKSEFDIFTDFFKLRLGRVPTDEEADIVIGVIKEIKEKMIQGERGASENETD